MRMFGYSTSPVLKVPNQKRVKSASELEFLCVCLFQKSNKIIMPITWRKRLEVKYTIFFRINVPFLLQLIHTVKLRDQIIIFKTRVTDKQLPRYKTTFMGTCLCWTLNFFHYALHGQMNQMKTFNKSDRW